MSKSNAASQSMMLVTSGWGGIPSFSLMPVNNECPYVECLYNPMAKTLAVIGKTKKDSFHMIPRLDTNGHPEKLKVGATPENPNKKQRVSQESYTEYYLTERKEVEAFIELFAVNHATFDVTKTLDMESMDDPNKAGILTGPQAKGKKESKIITLDKK